MAEFYFVATDKNDALAYACEMDIPVNNLWKCAEKEHYVCQFNSHHMQILFELSTSSFVGFSTIEKDSFRRIYSDISKKNLLVTKKKYKAYFA